MPAGVMSSGVLACPIFLEKRALLDKHFVLCYHVSVNVLILLPG
jgi:hypothetical protein